MGAEKDIFRFVVGLGNPGQKYRNTRHNVGFMVLDELRKRWKLPEPSKKFEGQFNDARLTGPRGRQAKVMLLAPQTYMNCSGRSVSQMMAFYKADLRDLIVVLDDLAIPPGRIRIRADGSAGGHNGLSDVIAAAGSNAVARLRIGIGAAPQSMDAADYVLSPFAASEASLIEDAVKRAADAIEDWIWHDLGKVMSRHNKKSDDQPQGKDDVDPNRG